MAAYAALLSLELAIDKILPTVQDYVFFPLKENDKDFIPLCRKEQLTSLHQKVIFLQKVLEEFPEKCSTLESRIRLIAHQLEDIIDSSISGPPFMYFASEVEILSVELMYSAFGTCTQQLDSIVQEAKQMTKNGKNENKCSSNSLTASTSSSGPSSGKDTMIARDEDLTEILNRATRYDRALQFIPIVGMGGIGKTTLARKIYEHPLIVKHFDVCSWITVSQEYDIKQILLGLLSREGENGEDVETLIVHLYQKLFGRRFLVVLDDMWDAEVWYEVMRAFPDCEKGSRVIITTRLSEMVHKVNSESDIHNVKLMNNDQSWSLMCGKVFGEEDCPPQLENVGKIIARNCKGLPLAIIVIAGLLKVDKTQAYWEKIAGNVVEAATGTSNDQLHRILSLSYKNLPHHMKACFLYMGVLPEDKKIDSSYFIWLLVGEGFIKAKGSKSMEEVAKEYMKDLVTRNLVMFSKEDRYDQKYYSLHDVLRELCIRKAEEENFLQHCKYMDEINISKIIKGKRRLIIHHSEDFPFLPNNIDKSPLRGILYFDPYWDTLYIGPFWDTTSLMQFTSQFKLLKMVYNLFVRPEDLSSPESIIFKLIHLRFLGMDVTRGYGDIHIDESIVKLQNLQTLMIKNKDLGRGKFIFPWNFWRMPKLRHLDLDKSFLPVPDIHYCVGTHYDLQTLSGVKNFKFTMYAIDSFSNLKILRIVIDKVAYLDNIVLLHSLEELDLTYYGEIMNIPFPPNLKRLTLSSSWMLWESMFNIGSLENLKVLKLHHLVFEAGVWGPIEGQFQKLKYLQMMDLEQLKKWNAEDTHFPCLEELFIRECSFEIPDSIGDMPTLQKLTVQQCPEKTIEWAIRIEEKQLEEYGNDKFQLKLGQYYLAPPDRKYPMHWLMRFYLLFTPFFYVYDFFRKFHIFQKN